MFLTTVPNGTTAGSCNAAATSFNPIMTYFVSPGQTVTWNSSSPLTVAPPAGQTRCLLIRASNDSGSPLSNVASVYVSGTGYVSAGTYTGPHNTSIATLPKAVLSGKTTGHH